MGMFVLVYALGDNRNKRQRHKKCFKSCLLSTCKMNFLFYLFSEELLKKWFICESPINKIFKNHYGKHSYHDNGINSFNILQNQIKDSSILKTKIKQTNTFFLTKNNGRQRRRKRQMEQNIEVDISISRSKEKA